MQSSTDLTSTVPPSEEQPAARELKDIPTEAQRQVIQDEKHKLPVVGPLSFGEIEESDFYISYKEKKQETEIAEVETKLTHSNRLTTEQKNVQDLTAKLKKIRSEIGFHDGYCRNNERANYGLIASVMSSFLLIPPLVLFFGFNRDRIIAENHFDHDVMSNDQTCQQLFSNFSLSIASGCSLDASLFFNISQALLEVCEGWACDYDQGDKNFQISLYFFIAWSGICTFLWLLTFLSDPKANCKNDEDRYGNKKHPYDRVTNQLTDRENFLLSNNGEFMLFSVSDSLRDLKRMQRRLDQVAKRSEEEQERYFVSFGS